MDIFGSWQLASIPASAIDEELLARGFTFDDAIRKPDLATARLDSLRGTLSLVCDDETRHVARRAQEFLRSSGIADTAYVAPHVEFYILDSLAFENGSMRAGYAIEAKARGTGLDEMAHELAACGIGVEAYRCNGNAGQASIHLKGDSPLKTSDDIVTLKDVVKTVASRHGKLATFMPKPLFGERASGMPCFQSLWKDGRPLFFDPNGYAECSQTMLYYIGGILAHAASLLAFVAPSTNSYRRLAGGDDAPVNIAFSARNRSAAIRIPAANAGHAKAKRLEFRLPDPSAQPYLAFSAILLAGLDGIARKIDPVRAGFGPLDRTIASLSADERAKLGTVPRSLGASLAALGEDRDYLTAGGVFTHQIIDEWIARKTEAELVPVEARPHPYEYHLYSNC